MGWFIHKERNDLVSDMISYVAAMVDLLLHIIYSFQLLSIYVFPVQSILTFQLHAMPLSATQYDWYHKILH